MTASDGYEHHTFEIEGNPGHDNFYAGVDCNNESGSGPEICPPYQLDNFKVVWHIPVIKLSQKPKKKTTSRQAKFAFDTDEEIGTGFECSLDGKPFQGCLSPRIYSVKPGEHILRIQGAGGSEPPPPLSYRWKVVKN
jgi:hypothetical protein